MPPSTQPQRKTKGKGNGRSSKRATKITPRLPGVEQTTDKELERVAELYEARTNELAMIQEEVTGYKEDIVLRMQRQGIERYRLSDGRFIQLNKKYSISILKAPEEPARSEE